MLDLLWLVLSPVSRAVLCCDPAAARAIGSYGCRSGDLSAPALDQKKQPDGEQNAGNDSD
jgi:hypothetical protein